MGFETTAQEIVAHASAVGWHITTAESCTGGMVSAALTDVPGSSAVFTHGFVTYSNAAKSQLLGVSASVLEANGAVSEPVVEEMAKGALKAAHADLAVSISGIAGPGGSEHKPEGRVCFGIATAERCITETHDFGALGRATVRAVARDYALRLLLRHLPDL